MAKQIHTIAELREVVPNAHKMTELKLLDHLDEQAGSFLTASPFLLLATAGMDGHIDVSPRGDEPGFVRIEDERTIVIPERQGNNLAFSLQNIIENPNVGVIVLLPNAGETLRINGRAAILADPELLQELGARGRPAMLAIRISIQRAYFQCARAFLRADLWKPEKWPQPRKVSFGRIIGESAGLKDDSQKQIDSMVEQSYKSL
ncbi:MAG TPA: MSMEG_1061 family FMN-dependent PPOX-type flavoprotein [Candidatus Binataceae bacterium]|nr:MSMEG_1061 family FMN-dependent PPOX-type flavoprotein [Candidatus Binataceae bacterium]